MNPPQDIQLVYVEFTPTSIPTNMSRFVVHLGTSYFISKCFSPTPNPSTAYGFFFPCTKTYGVNNVTLTYITTSQFQLKIAEVVIGFLPDRTLNILFFCNHCGCSNFHVQNVLAFPPVLSDCSELYREGFTATGVYFIDPGRNRDKGESSVAYCQGGWTYFLRRIAVRYPISLMKIFDLALQSKPV